MALVWQGEWGTYGASDVVLLIVAIALVVVIVANTAVMATRSDSYRWWYGLVKFAFYFGSFALTLATGGASAAIASVSTFLGMELNKLAQLLHIYGIFHAFGNGKRAYTEAKESQDTAER
jgi:hypothetical protein